MTVMPPLKSILCLCLAACAESAPAMDPGERARAKEELARVSAEAFKVSRAFELIHEIVGPSVVSIHTHQQVHQLNLNPNDQSLREEVRQVPIGEGSGFIFHADDSATYILTNSHVVLQTNSNKGFVRDLNREPVGYDRVTVMLNDNREIVAEYVGFDLQTDLAVLKIPLPNLPTIDWADSDRARVGDWVLALGYPFGVGYSATSGIISATDRSTGIYGGVGGFESFIQTDASINPGNSGGPLVNLEGQVIGVNANIISQDGASIGLGFAIPANLAHRVADDVVEHGKVIRPRVGIYLDELSPDRALALGLPQAQTVLVTLVIPGSPADLAGLKKEDIILAVNKVPIQSVQQFRSRVASSKVGVPLPMQLWRKGAEISVDIVPIADHDLGAKLEREANSTKSQSGGTDLGAFGLRVDSDEKPGVVVTEVDADGLAAQAGLAPGDRILHERDAGPINGAKELALLAGKREVVLQVLKNGRSLWVRLRR